MQISKFFFMTMQHAKSVYYVPFITVTVSSTSVLSDSSFGTGNEQGGRLSMVPLLFCVWVSSCQLSAVTLEHVNPPRQAYTLRWAILAMWTSSNTKQWKLSLCVCFTMRNDWTVQKYLFLCYFFSRWFRAWAFTKKMYTVSVVKGFIWVVLDFNVSGRS